MNAPRVAGLGVHWGARWGNPSPLCQALGLPTQPGGSRVRAGAGGPLRALRNVEAWSPVSPRLRGVRAPSGTAVHGCRGRFGEGQGPVRGQGPVKGPVAMATSRGPPEAARDWTRLSPSATLTATRNGSGLSLAGARTPPRQGRGRPGSRHRAVRMRTAWAGRHR